LLLTAFSIPFSLTFRVASRGLRSVTVLLPLNEKMGSVECGREKKIDEVDALREVLPCCAGDSVSSMRGEARFHYTLNTTRRVLLLSNVEMSRPVGEKKR